MSPTVQVTGGGVVDGQGGGPWASPQRATWTPPLEEDIYYGRLPWAESQSVFATRTDVPGGAYIATCGWHGTVMNPERGAFALVAVGGTLAGLVGESVRITYAASGMVRSVYVSVLSEASILEDISVSRRAFAALAPLAFDSPRVSVSVVA